MPDQQTVDALIRERATSDPAKPMVIDPDTRISYGELDAGTRTIAAGFIEAGVGRACGSACSCPTVATAGESLSH